jgi:YHS domain-containing protein
MYRNLTPIVSVVVAMACAVSANAQVHQHEHTAPGHNHAMHDNAGSSNQVANGPHGGSLRQSNGIQLETVVSQGGIQMFVFDRAGKPIAVDQGRGAASLRVEGNAKRYRYDLLPDGKGGLTAPVNLSAIAGRQIEIDIQLVGIATPRGRTVSFQEVASVPASEQQLAAAAIARQKICPVTGKPLGSMGDPVAVDVDGQRLYVCCAGCVDTVKANPAKYAAGRPDITVTSATEADAPLIARQRVCPVMDEPLGSMGQPIKVMVGDKPIFLCCKGCIKKIQAEPAKYLAMVYGNGEQTQAPSHGAVSAVVSAGVEQVRAGVFKVTAADAPFVAAQKRCPVMDEPLDAMGGPFKVNAAGKAIYICCPGCAKKIAAKPQKYLDILAKQGVNAPLLR